MRSQWCGCPLPNTRDLLRRGIKADAIVNKQKKGDQMNKHVQRRRIEHRNQPRTHLMVTMCAACVPGLFEVAAAAAPDSNKSVEEVVVTAQRRIENVQNVPISIAVLGGEQLDHANFAGATEALRSTPGFDTQVGQYAGNSAFVAVRGVSNAARSGGTGVVAYYIDGVPYGFVREAYYPNAGVYDLDRIEALAGPQGTLYGANALNGVVRVLTHDANADQFEFKARTFVSTTEKGGNNEGGDFAVNVPIIDQRLGVRAAVSMHNNDGWIDAPGARNINDEETRNYRLRVRATPTERLSISALAWRSEDEIGAPSASLDDKTILSRVGGAGGTLVPYVEQPGSNQFDTYGLRIDQEFKAFTLSSMTSSIDYKSQGTVWGGPVGFHGTLYSRLTSRIFSQEFNIISNGDGLWNWSAGAFYRDAEDRTFQHLHGTGFVFELDTNNFTDESESYAVYGELRRQLTDGLHLAVGLRYFSDEETVTANMPYPGAVLIPAGTSFAATSDAVTPRVVLTWTPNDNQTFYASYSQGFRSGFAQQPNVQRDYPNFTPADPDTLTNYEIGAKGSTAGGRLNYEAAVFYIDWRDVQQNLSVVVSGTPLSTQATINGESASGIGASVAANWEAFENVNFGLNAVWNNLTVDAAVVDPSLGPIFNRGDRLDMSPEWTAGASIDYSWGLGGGFNAQATLAADYKSPQVTTTLVPYWRKSDDLLVARVRLAIEAPRNWTLAIFGENITDEYGASLSYNLTPTTTPEWNTRIRPRTVGVQLELSF